MKAFNPTFCQELENYQMDMHIDGDKKYSFILTGLKLYHPNMCSANGYGSDDWFFQAKNNGQDYILRFRIDAGYGAMWDCAVITNADAQQLHCLSDMEWLSLMMKSKDRIYHLHPDSIDTAKEIVQAASSQCGTMSDKEFYGQ